MSKTANFNPRDLDIEFYNFINKAYENHCAHGILDNIRIKARV